MATNLSYWTRRRVSRRAALRGAGLGAAGLAGAALIGCGDDDDDEAAAPAPAAPTQAAAATQAPAATATQAAAAPTPTEEPSVLTTRVDSTAEAVPGGIFESFATGDVESLDPLTTGAFSTMGITRWVYPTLVLFTPGIIDTPTGDVEPGLAESWEFVDPTTLVLHIRSDAKWDQRAPTNSRKVDAQDVVFSWDRFAATGVQRASLANIASEFAPILNMEAIDDQTVQVNTAFQFGPLVGSLGYPYWTEMMPVEAEGGFDPRNEMRGAGPWVLDRYDRSVRFEFRKNPNFWRKDRPFVDGIDLPIISEYAQRLAQFRAGKVWHGVVSQADVISTKEEITELDVYQGDFSRGDEHLFFGFRPDSPFLDPRVRLAVSLLIERDLVLDTFNKADDFREAGWPVETRWASLGVMPGYDAFWADPQGINNQVYTEEQKKAFEFNPAEAKKLMDAAGHGGGLKTAFTQTERFGATRTRLGKAYLGMLEASGLFELEERTVDYTTEFLPNLFYGQSDHEGIVWTPSATFPHVGQHLNNFYHSGGLGQKICFNHDPSTVEGTAAADALIEKALRALDFEDQVDLIHQYQRDNILRMPLVNPGGTGGMPSFELSWPWAKNLGTYRDFLSNTPNTTFINWWVDEKLRKEMQG